MTIAPPKTLITLDRVAVRYKRKGNLLKPATYYDALTDVSMKIGHGEVIGIYGKNGSGKSTLLKVITGILKPNSGTITNHGASVSLLALQAGFDMNLNGSENAILGGMLQGLSRKDATANLKVIEDYADIGEFFYEPVRTYSTGMLARLGFAVAITTDPDILLIDEVLSVGDKEFRKKAEHTILSRLGSHQSIVIVSHSMHRLKQLCDRVILIEDGVARPYEDA